MAKTSAGRSAVSRAVEILNAFGPGSLYLSATEIAQRTDNPVPSTHRRLQELTSLGLIDRASDRTYRLGARLWEWAALSPGATGLRAAALPHLQEVHHYVRQHAQIGILTGNDVLFIERLSAPDSVINYSVIGQRLPALASSSGLAQLAFIAEEERERILEHGVDQLTPSTMTDPEEIRRRLVAIRLEGYVVNDGFIHTSARGIAVPIHGHQKDLLGALSVIVPNDDSPVTPRVNLLRRAAAGISRDYARLTRGQRA